jgi:hypothetical protein
MYESDPLNALDALTAAQRLAFAPLAFQASVALRDRGVLAALAAAPAGCTTGEVAQRTGLTPYAARVLLEAGLGLQILWRRDGRFRIGRLGRFLLDDELTRVNVDFVRDVCYPAAAHLDESLTEGRPVGLKTLGPWATLYEGLSVLPEPARRSWHAFDHYYSDQAFPAVCERLAAAAPATLLDVGCNTGRWAEFCLSRLPALQVGLVDLPLQLERARARLSEAELAARATFHPLDLLADQAALPGGYELIWMSQFLDCFSDEQVVAILAKARAALTAAGRLWILEVFWDRQRFEGAAFSLQQTSLYFTCVANGNSQMYEATVFLGLVERAGLVVERQSDGIGGFHTLLECRAA